MGARRGASGTQRAIGSRRPPGRETSASLDVSRARRTSSFLRPFALSGTPRPTKVPRFQKTVKRREGGAQTVSRRASPKSRASVSAVQPRSPGTSGQSASTTGSPARSRASAPARSVFQDVRGMATSRGAAADQGGGGSAGGPRASTKGRGS